MNEADKMWTKHLLEREELKAENARLRARNAEQDKEIERLKLDRQNVKRAIEDLLERYGQLVATTPHYGLGRAGVVRAVKDED